MNLKYVLSGLFLSALGSTNPAPWPDTTAISGPTLAPRLPPYDPSVTVHRTKNLAWHVLHGRPLTAESLIHVLLSVWIETRQHPADAPAPNPFRWSVPVLRGGTLDLTNSLIFSVYMINGRQMKMTYADLAMEVQNLHEMVEVVDGGLNVVLSVLGNIYEPGGSIVGRFAVEFGDGISPEHVIR